MTPAAVGFHCPECLRAGQASTLAPRRVAPGLAAARWGRITLAVIAANLAMFVLQVIAALAAGHGPFDAAGSPVFTALAQVPAAVAAGEWWRVVTAAFLHLGPLHLGLNMLAVLLFGSEVERRLGMARFAAVYGVSILGGAAALQLFGDPLAYAAGASTAIYGLMGALGVVMLAGREDLRALVTLLLLNFVISLMPGVSLVGHLGGLVAGAATAAVLVVGRRRPPVQLAGVAVLALALLVLALTAPVAGVYPGA